VSLQKNQLNQSPLARHTLYGVPEGYDAVLLARMARESAAPLLHIAADDMQLEQLYEGLRFFAPDVEILRFPAWDCLPYDRVSPTVDIIGERLKTLSQLLHRKTHKPLIILTTIAAALQRIPARDLLANSVFNVSVGDTLDTRALQDFLTANGYHRTETVREAGEYALRGGLIDIFPSGAAEPLRLDCFGNEIENIRAFDALSQRTTADRESLSLYPVSEVLLTPQTIETFRTRYRELFGAVRKEDALYESVSEGRKYAGLEHWLPLYYPQLETIFDYVTGAVITLSHQVGQAQEMRLQQIADLYQSRVIMLQSEQKQPKSTGAQYRPIPVNLLYIPIDEFQEKLVQHSVIDLSPFAATLDGQDGGGKKGRDFGAVRVQPKLDLYAAIRDHIAALNQAGKQVLIATYGIGASTRFKHLLAEQGVLDIQDISSIAEFKKIKIAMTVLGLEHGFEAPDFAVLTEQDLLGDRLSRPHQKKKKSDAFIFEISQLHEGDFVTHRDHGIGQFDKLEIVTVDNIPHDCLKLIYAGGDKLFVPVENLDVLSRYGSAEAGATLDKLGSTAWQARKAGVKRDLLALASALMDIAALRVLQHTESIHTDAANYEKFCAGFPYPETDDQQRAIEDVLDDLSRNQAMDRLVCGDVGFGKTEVALRAAAMTAFAGYQVALIAPTTLLARQHYQTFTKRFQGFPINIALLSRFVTGKEADKIQADLKTGEVNILIGTHSILSEKLRFNNLALLVVDEEQKFGVKQKERLKQIKENVHVLTLTATPIPRTLQMALSGVRELSLITTAPIDRLAVKTFVLPYDPVVIRDALMREHYRGGQSFYVCPRIADMEALEKQLRDLVPELRIVIAHGQMGAEEMEEKMSAFYEGAFDVLLSTTIVESGLDIPNANTMVIHRAEMFGLAQLYQLRGRIGRSKQRAYAYITFDHRKKLTKTAEQRLHAIEQLDSLGAGFQLASHDLDIRGAGNLLGEEQSGHIREVGVELYQQMLEEAVSSARAGGNVADVIEKFDTQWSPQINLGMPVMIPDSYITDLNLRLSIYRRIAELTTKQEIESFAAELIDRFGTLPDDVENLLNLVEIKQLCRQAGVDRIDAGEKGAVVSLHSSSTINIQKLVAYIGRQSGTVKIRPADQKLVFIKAWSELPQRLKGVHKILNELLGLV
jgi:transcription-repair coupling factor (superfamily II helicase)